MPELKKEESGRRKSRSRKEKGGENLGQRSARKLCVRR